MENGFFVKTDISGKGFGWLSKYTAPEIYGTINIWHLIMFALQINYR